MAEQPGQAKYKNEKTVRLDVSADSKASIDPLLHTSSRHSLINMHCLISHENMFILHYLSDV